MRNIQNYVESTKKSSENAFSKTPKIAKKPGISPEPFCVFLNEKNRSETLRFFREIETLKLFIENGEGMTPAPSGTHTLRALTGSSPNSLHLTAISQHLTDGLFHRHAL